MEDPQSVDSSTHTPRLGLTGLHVEPNIPTIPGIEKVPSVMHSSEFKSRSQFGTDTTVMVLGSGETGADIADGFHFAPKRNPGPTILPILGRGPNPKEPGIPIDISRANLFDTAYVHPRLRDHMLLWNYYEWYVKSLLWIGSGTTHGMHQWIGGIPAKKHHVSRIFFNKSMKACPYISEPYRPKTGYAAWVYNIRAALVQTPISPTNGRQIDLAPWPEEFDSQGLVRFKNNGRLEYERMKDEKIRPGIIVLCTGYTQSFPFFDKNNMNSAQQDPYSGSTKYPMPSETDVRGIWKRDDPSSYKPSYGF
ncbi:hypothetical protein DV736_g5833, partial [Chaetothyriales sp. CBS 134916]